MPAVRREVTLLNRSLPRAQELAAEFPEVRCSVDLMPALLPAVESADVVFTASSSNEVLLRGQDLAELPTRGQHVGGIRRCLLLQLENVVKPPSKEQVGRFVPGALTSLSSMQLQRPLCGWGLRRRISQTLDPKP